MNPEKDETRDKIVEAARTVFARYGFKKTTVDEVAAAAHKAKSSIYYYFSSKEEIFKAVVESEAAVIREHLILGISEYRTAGEKLKAYINIRMMRLREMANFYEAIKSDYLSHYEFIEKIREKYDHEEATIIQSILLEGVAAKEFRVEDPELAGIAIVTAMKGLEIPLAIKYQGDLVKRLEGLMAILFYGIMNR
jgi:AcrR family transcriptional regulator